MVLQLKLKLYRLVFKQNQVCYRIRKIYFIKVFFYLGADPNAELVRHYLIERTPTGHVRLKGCSNEPDFGMKIFSLDNYYLV